MALAHVYMLPLLRVVHELCMCKLLCNACMEQGPAACMCLKPHAPACASL